MMHEKDVKAKLLKCLQADKIIHEQMLGLLWFPPRSAAPTTAKRSRTSLSGVASAGKLAIFGWTVMVRWWAARKN